MNHAIGIAEVIRRRLFARVDGSGMERMAVALSGGVDSCSVLAAQLEQGFRPTVLSYTPDTHESTDFQMAKACAESLGLDFIPVIVDMDLEALERDAREVIAFGYHTKLEVESMTPMVSILRAAQGAGIQQMFTGDQADGFFINNNWMARNFDRARGIPGYLRTAVSKDDDPWRIDTLRDIYWDEDRSCSKAIQHVARDKYDVLVSVPYRDNEIRLAFRGSLWRDVNQPRIKEPIRLAFPEWLDTKIPTRKAPINLHKGDSYFADRMGKTLMEAPHLKGSWRTTTGLYSAIARGEV